MIGSLLVIWWGLSEAALAGAGATGLKPTGYGALVATQIRS